MFQAQPRYRCPRPCSVGLLALAPLALLAACSRQLTCDPPSFLYMGECVIDCPRGHGMCSPDASDARVSGDAQDAAVEASADGDAPERVDALTDLGADANIDGTSDTPMDGFAFGDAVDTAAAGDTRDGAVDGRDTALDVFLDSVDDGNPDAPIGTSDVAGDMSRDGSRCDGGLTICGATCAAVDNDPLNCGSCAHTCAAVTGGSAICSAGVCDWICNAGQMRTSSGCDAVPPRPVSPLSTSFVTTSRPTLRWALPVGIDGAAVDICRRRACAIGDIEQILRVSGSSAVPTDPLPPGTWYWRLRGTSAGITGRANSVVWQFQVGVRDTGTDSRWNGMLDINGDGYADAALTSSVSSGTGIGRLHVFRGSVSGLSATPTSLTNAMSDLSHFGASVADGGDINGDGFGDLLVGETRAATDHGRVHLYLGSASGLVATPVVITGPTASEGFGTALAGLGDVNGDGYGDLAVGAPSARNMSAVTTGTVYVYFGGPTGPSTVPTQVMAPVSDGFFGLSIAGIGDVNGDGLADFAIGNPAEAVSAGAAYVYFGSAAGLGAFAHAIYGSASGDRLGGALSGAGDVNGDGLADLVVGASGASASSGQAYVYLGRRTLFGTDVQPLANPGVAGDSFGGGLSRGGDVNHDGYSDVVIGAPIADDVAGLAYLYTGSATGLTATPIPMTAPDGADGYFGYAAVADDFNGDGFADVLLSAWGYMSAAGRGYVYSSGPSGLATTPAFLESPDGAGTNFGAVLAFARARPSFYGCALLRAESGPRCDRSLQNALR